MVIKNSRTVPEIILYQTDASLAKIVFTTDDITNVIKIQNSNKSADIDNLSIPVLKICTALVCKPLEIILRSSLNRGKPPVEWKRANDVPVFKKGDKQCVKITALYPCYQYVKDIWKNCI